MPSTHLSLHYHLIFSTKNRDPFIAEVWRGRLHAFLGGAVRNLGGAPEAVGGMGDHVHLLVGLRANHALADVLRDIKSASSHCVHDTVGVRGLAWQDGFASLRICG